MIANAAEPPLSGFTTLRTGGPAERLVVAETDAELIEAISTADAAGEPLTILGGGSNVVVTDEGVPGTVVLVRTRGVEVSVDACAGAWVTVAAGEPWDDLVARTVAEEWSGIEALSGIPGLTGATPIQNVGAYGQEVADTIARVTAYDRTARRIEVIAAGDCGFAYRTSRFKADPGRRVILSVTFQLPLGSMSAPVGYAELAARLGSLWGIGPPQATSARPCSTCGAARGWCSPPRITTRGASGRSSPTPWWTPTQSRRGHPPGPRRMAR